ncbi:LPS export ABC transporter permease LptF [Pleionea sediminis]|uniref:LPS export ABC transporter permease LptF n=1 Tax=Pleionea sediminis TaxID=2569479 RepID=UPI0011865732|nr:LPS export ABC transporter permease LptF [Pleionea sediminis]
MRLKKYLNKEVLLASSAVLSILLLIFSSQQFVRFLGDVVDGKIAPSLLIGMVALQMPPLVGFLLPLGFFLGILLAFGQLYVENELTVARSVGIGNVALAKMLLPMGLTFTFIAAFFSLWVAPWAASTQQDLLDEQKSRSELSFLTPGRFQVTSDGSGVMYAAQVANDNELRQIFFARLPDEELKSWKIISAESGKAKSLNQRNQLVLTSGQRYDLPVNDLSWSIMGFEQYQMTLPVQVDEVGKGKLKSVATLDLLSDLSQEHWAEFHWRLAIPLSILLLMLAAVPLSRVEPRQGKFAKMLPAILIYMSYMILIILTRGLIEDGKLPGVLGMWWVHFGFLAYALWQYRHSHRKHKKKR